MSLKQQKPLRVLAHLDARSSSEIEQSGTKSCWASNRRKILIREFANRNVFESRQTIKPNLSYKLALSDSEQEHLEDFVFLLSKKLKTATWRISLKYDKLDLSKDESIIYDKVIHRMQYGISSFHNEYEVLETNECWQEICQKWKSRKLDRGIGIAKFHILASLDKLEENQDKSSCLILWELAASTKYLSAFYDASVLHRIVEAINIDYEDEEIKLCLFATIRCLMRGKEILRYLGETAPTWDLVLNEFNKVQETQGGDSESKMEAQSILTSIISGFMLGSEHARNSFCMNKGETRQNNILRLITLAAREYENVSWEQLSNLLYAIEALINNLNGEVIEKVTDFLQPLLELMGNILDPQNKHQRSKHKYTMVKTSTLRILFSLLVKSPRPVLASLSIFSGLWEDTASNLLSSTTNFDNITYSHFEKHLEDDLLCLWGVSAFFKGSNTIELQKEKLEMIRVLLRHPNLRVSAWTAGLVSALADSRSRCKEMLDIGIMGALQDMLQSHHPSVQYLAAYAVSSISQEFGTFLLDYSSVRLLLSKLASGPIPSTKIEIIQCATYSLAKLCTDFTADKDCATYDDVLLVLNKLVRSKTFLVDTYCANCVTTALWCLSLHKENMDVDVTRSLVSNIDAAAKFLMNAENTEVSNDTSKKDYLTLIDRLLSVVWLHIQNRSNISSLVSFELSKDDNEESVCESRLLKRNSNGIYIDVLICDILLKKFMNFNSTMFLSLGVLWSLSEFFHSYVLFSVDGTVDRIAEIALCENLQTSTRLRAAVLLETIKSSPAVKEYGVEKWNRVLFTMFLSFIEDRNREIALFGLKACVRNAPEKANRILLGRLNAVEKLFASQLIKWKELDDSILEDSLKLALSLSTVCENQAKLVDLCLNTLVLIGRNNRKSVIKDLVSACINNVTKHPSTRSTVYKTELHFKSKDFITENQKECEKEDEPVQAEKRHLPKNDYNDWLEKITAQCDNMDIEKRPSTAVHTRLHRMDKKRGSDKNKSSRNRFVASKGKSLNRSLCRSLSETWNRKHKLIQNKHIAPIENVRQESHWTPRLEWCFVDDKNNHDVKVSPDTPMKISRLGPVHESCSPERFHDKISESKGLSPSLRPVTVHQFNHVPGAKVCNGLYRHIHTGNGEYSHFYTFDEILLSSNKVKFVVPSKEYIIKQVTEDLKLIDLSPPTVVVPHFALKSSDSKPFPGLCGGNETEMTNSPSLIPLPQHGHLLQNISTDNNICSFNEEWEFEDLAFGILVQVETNRGRKSKRTLQRMTSSRFSICRQMSDEKRLLIEKLKIDASSGDKSMKKRRLGMSSGTWSLNTSVWQQRSMDADSGDFIDTESTIEKCVEHDWNLCTKKHAVQKFLEFLVMYRTHHTKFSSMKKGTFKKSKRKIDEARNNMCEEALEQLHQEMEQECNDIKNIFIKYGNEIVSTFQFYASMGRHEPFCIHMYGFMDFASHAGIRNQLSRHCQSKDIDTIYASCCSQEQHMHHDNNPSIGLVRYEFLEALFRLAVHKYMMDGNITKPSQALDTLLSTHLHKEDNSFNEFRNERLYNEPVSKVLETFMPFLRQLFNDYADKWAAKKPKNTISVSDWTMMCQDYGLYTNKKFAYSEHMSILDFLSARMLIIKDFEDTQRYRHSKFIDFMEALCQVADSVETLEPLPKKIHDHIRSIGAHEAEEGEQGHISEHLSFRLYSLLNGMYNRMLVQHPSRKKLAPRLATTAAGKIRLALEER